MADTKTSVNSKNVIPDNPFPGLRPFRTDEAHLFFGRRKQSGEIVNKLITNRFCAVTGASGSGKSSLIYCGVITSLQNPDVSAQGNWHTLVSRPGNSPMTNLLEKIKKADKKGTALNIEKPEDLPVILRKVFPDKQDRLLMIIDQFEEVFRFSEKDLSNPIDSATFFTRVLTELVSQQLIPVYLIITMRSDFIGECSQFLQLTSLINSSNYLVPRMTRDDFKEVIDGPVSTVGAKINTDLVDKMLEDLGDNPDQLPVLQHVLMRTWNYWKLHNEFQRPVSIPDYDAVGRIEKALSEHANEAFGELNEREKEVCERIFRTVTEKGTDNKGVRKPARVDKLIEITQASREEVIKVLDTFRSQGRSFITPSIETMLTDSTVIDISHESFMRIWDRLRAWVDEEASAVQMYKRLSESALQYQSGQSGLWRPPDLQLALNWKRKNKPTLAWAERHNPAYERTMVFLDTSEGDFLKEEENKLRLQKRQLRRTRLFAVVLGSAAIVSLGLFIWTRELQVTAQNEFQRAETQRVLAEEKTQEAQKQSELAAEKTLEAQKQSEIAEKNAEEATEQRAVAESQSKLAEEQRLEAEKNADEAQRQAELALTNQQEAQAQREQAELAREEAFQRRMLTTAQSMAVKSLQATTDSDLRALLAYQAYKFNMQYEGLLNNVDIYTGLYQALKTSLGETYNVFSGHNDAVRSVHFIPGTNFFVSAGSEGNILKWDIDDESRKYSTIAQGRNMIEEIIVSPDGKWLATAENNVGLAIYNLNNSSPKPTVYKGLDENIRAMVIDNDNKTLFTAGMANVIEYWDLETGRNRKFAEAGMRVNSLSLSSDGTLLAGGTREGKLMVWRTKGELVTSEVYADTSSSIQCVAFAPDSRYLAAGNIKGDILIFSADNFELVRVLSRHQARITDLGFSPDGKTLASSSYDSKVMFWNMDDLTSPPIEMDDHSGFAFSVAFSTKGDYMISGSSEGNKLIKRPAYSTLLADQICKLVKRNLTEDEWKTYVGEDIPYEQTCKRIEGMSIEIRQN